MKNLNHKLRLPAALALFFAMQAAYALVPEGYQAVIDGAKKEGKLLVYSVTDTALVRPLIKDFESLYGIKVEYNDMNSTRTAPAKCRPCPTADGAAWARPSAGS